MERRIDDPNLDVQPDDVLVMRQGGPLGAPGMPEWGFLPLPKKLLQQGIRDMVRISDARMSGTAFGTVVVHATPESAAGGPLAAVRTGDLIELDVPNRRLDLLVEPAEVARRLAAMPQARPITDVATAGSLHNTFCRRTKAAILISCVLRAWGMSCEYLCPPFLILDILPSLSHDLGHIRAGVMVAALCQESRHARV